MSIRREHPTKQILPRQRESLVNGLKSFPPGTIPSFDLVPSYKSKVTIAKLTTNFTASLFYENDQADEALGKPERVIFHWSAGRYNQAWDGYHYNIGFNDKTKTAVVMRCLGLNQKGKHLWGRNGGSVGISLLAMANGFPVTEEQMQAAARLAAEYCAWRHIDPRAKEIVPQMMSDSRASRIWATGKQITMPVVTDHARYANEDGYGRWRNDIGTKFSPIYNELLKIYDGLKAGREKFQFQAIL